MSEGDRRMNARRILSTDERYRHTHSLRSKVPLVEKFGGGLRICGRDVSEVFCTVCDAVRILQHDKNINQLYTKFKLFN